jgi:hypothetical protein
MVWVANRESATLQGERKHLARSRTKLNARNAVLRHRISPGGLLDLGDCHRPGSQKVEHNLDPAWDRAITPPPAANVSRFDPKYLGDALLREAERAKGRAKFNRNRVP